VKSNYNTIRQCSGIANPAAPLSPRVLGAPLSRTDSSIPFPTKRLYTKQPTTDLHDHLRSKRRAGERGSSCAGVEPQRCPESKRLVCINTGSSPAPRVRPSFGSISVGGRDPIIVIGALH
jgi:hypothetical protein